MLLRFRCSNFRSFKDELVISAVSRRRSGRLFNGNVLPVIALYGANASGKSNAFRALGWMRNFVLHSGKNNSTDSINVEPFVFVRECREKPMNFEVTFSQGKRVFRYGFSVTRTRIVEEWLFTASEFGGTERRCFRRRQNAIEANAEIRRLAKLVLPNSLLLSKMDQNNMPLARSVMGWMLLVTGLNGVDIDDLYAISAHKLSDGGVVAHNRSLEFLRKADPTIIDTTTKTEAVSQDSMLALALKNRGRILRNGTTITKTMILRRSQESDSILVGTEFNSNESAGTRKMFMLSGPVTDVLSRGGVMAIDELESELHPMLVDYVIELFASPETNPKQAQLIFTTHDVGMMERAHLSAEQVYICAKNLNSESIAYSLAEFPARARKKGEIVGNYLRGDYGGVPSLDSCEWLYRKFADRRDIQVEER